MAIMSTADTSTNPVWGAYANGKKVCSFPLLVKVYVLCTACLYDVYIRPETTLTEISRETTAHMYNDTVNISYDHHLLYSSSGLVGQGVLHANLAKDMYLYCTHMYVLVTKHRPGRSTCILHLAWSVTGGWEVSPQCGGLMTRPLLSA